MFPRENPLQQIINMRLSIVGSLVLAFTLSVFAIDPDWRWLRPEFVVLMVIYWSVHEPQYFGLYAAWWVGLLQDIIQLDILGPNALLLSIVAYICQLFYRRIQNYGIWQQSGLIFVLIGVHSFFNNWISGLTDGEVPIPAILINALITAFLWPLVVYLFKSLTGQSTLHKQIN